MSEPYDHLAEIEELEEFPTLPESDDSEEIDDGPCRDVQLAAQ